MLKEQSGVSNGTSLQSSNPKLYKYPLARKDSEHWGLQSVSLRNHSKSTTGVTDAANGYEARRPFFRVSTGNLPLVKRESKRPVLRASTGTLPPVKIAYPATETHADEKELKPRGSHHHILARNLGYTNHEIEQLIGCTKNYDEAGLTSRCRRCGAKLKSHHFECNDCTDFRLCSECGDGGIYCEDDTHSWVEKSLRYIGGVPQVIGKISCVEARTLYYGVKTYPSIFRPPSQLDTPGTLFSDEHRFIRRSNPREILIYCDGVCIRKSSSESIGGWAFVYRPSAYDEDGVLSHAGTISARLETKGPTGQIHTATSNRAELRSAIAALQFIDWSKDCNRGWRSVVIATDSEYVTCSVTKWISDWEYTKWKLGDNTDVNNKDLWMLLLDEVRRYHTEGVKIAFWRIPRDCNLRAYDFAKRATFRGYKNRVETVIFRPDGPVKVRVTPFMPK